MQREKFIPHELGYLESIRAFPEGAIPPSVYEKHKEQYESILDITVERVTYESDGLNITGIIATPKTPPKGIVVYNRGGSANFGILTLHAIIRQFIPLARAGYLVVGSNYRGNDGGEGRDEFGGRDVDDSIRLYDLAAPKDLPSFIIGHSRGCMQTYLMLKKGFKANAVIGIAGVADTRVWNNFRSEMREQVYKCLIPNFESDEQEALEVRSVLCWPEKITAPVLLLHGTGDDRVQYQQSEMLSDALKQLGKECELVLYQGSNHALTRHWDDVMSRTLQWFEKHV